jgi:hypothetical protein
VTISYASPDIKPYIPAFDSFPEARAGWMDDISVDVAVSRELGYQSIVSNRGARAARAHARKTLGYEEGKGEGGGEGGGMGEGESIGEGTETGVKEKVEVEAVEGSRARRRRENKEKKERELALIGVDGQFPVRREGRVREGTRRERGTGVYLAQSTEISTEFTGNIIATTENKVLHIVENKGENNEQESRNQIEDEGTLVSKKDLEV